MNIFPSREQVERIKSRYPEGARVELIMMCDAHTRLTPGEKGTVALVDDIGTIHVSWDNGSQLGVVYGEDSVRIISEGQKKDRHQPER